MVGAFFVVEDVVVDLKLIEYGVVIVVMVVVVAPLIAIVRGAMRQLSESNNRIAAAVDHLHQSNETQNLMLQKMTDGQNHSNSQIQSMAAKIDQINEKLARMPESVRENVIDATNDFLDKLSTALKQTNSVPQNFSFRENGDRRGFGRALGRILGVGG